MPNDEPKRRISGGAALIARGKKPMNLGWDPQDFAVIAAAAAADHRPMTQFVQLTALAAAHELLSEKGLPLPGVQVEEEKSPPKKPAPKKRRPKKST